MGYLTIMKQREIINRLFVHTVKFQGMKGERHAGLQPARTLHKFLQLSEFK
jgi:hypothetical protein